MKNLFIISDTGDMLDARASAGFRVIRSNYSRHHRNITSGADMRACLRAGAYAWPGGYEVYGVTNDGAALCFDCIRAELRQVISAIRARDNSGWRVVAIGCTADSDGPVDCDHCGKAM